MVDVMTSNSDTVENHLDNDVDLEDGELPEEGEISDDEETPLPSSTKDSPARPGSGKPAIRGRVDHDGRATMETTGDRAIDAWGAKVSGQSATSPKQRTDDPFGDTDYRNEGDKDYRNAYGEDDFGDSDYRMDRRRRRSPSPGGGDWGDRPFKRMRGGFGMRGGRGGSRFAGRDTGHVICKFYREGYCRDADHCAFSHQAEDSLRKNELCKFYKSGFCKKGLHCNSLHGEFPCIRFHRGECTREDCGYSHLPLTEYTTKIVEKVNKEEEEYNNYYGRTTMPLVTTTVAAPPAVNGAIRLGLAPPIPQMRGPGPLPPLPMPPNYVPPAVAVTSEQSPPHSGGLQMPPGFSLAAKRRVLLPSGPNAPLTNPLLGSGSPDPSAPLPPPSVIVPSLARSAYSPPNNGYGSPYYGANTPTQPAVSEPVKEEPVSTGFNISQMLAQFTSAPSTSAMDESPASPPPTTASGNAARFIPSSREVIWRLVPVSAPPTYSTVDPAVANRCSQADPRLSKLLSSQFDAVSSLISAAPKSTVVPPPKLVDPRSLVDPRLRASADPRPKASWMPTISS